MKVKELIEILKKFPPNAHAYIASDSEGEYKYEIDSFGHDDKSITIYSKD